MIEETYQYFCLRGLSRFPAPGNPRGRKFDLFRARQGSPINFGKIYENWASDIFTLKLSDEDLNAPGRNSVSTTFGKGRFVSNKAIFGLRAGLVENPITVFQDTHFILKFNGAEKYRFTGWDDCPRELYWRLEGGETLNLDIFSEGALNMPQGSFIYIDLVVHYEPQALILDDEYGSRDVSKGSNGSELERTRRHF